MTVSFRPVPGPFPQGWCWLRSWPTSSGGASRRGWGGGAASARARVRRVRAGSGRAAQADARHRCRRPSASSCSPPASPSPWAADRPSAPPTHGPVHAPPCAPAPTPGWPTTAATRPSTQLGATASLALAPATGRADGGSGHAHRPAPARRPRGLRLRALLDAGPVADASTITGLSTLAYFSIDVNGERDARRERPGWDGFQSQDLADLITRAHAAGRAGRAHGRPTSGRARSTR